MKKRSLLAVLVLPLMVMGEEKPLQLRCIPPANLVRNADFKKTDSRGRPEGWRFDNCSRSPLFSSRIVTHPEGSWLAVNTDWQKFGYWLQSIPVKEGVTYYVSVEVQSDAPAPALWVRCKADKKTSGKKSRDIEYVLSARLHHSDEMKEVLKDFIEEKLIRTLSPVTWNRIGKEIKIPANRGTHTLEMRIGIFGGDAGQARFRNPVLREAGSVLEAKISGPGWTLLKVRGAKPGAVKLDPAKTEQTVSVVMPAARRIYTAELFGANGKKVTAEAINE